MSKKTVLLVEDDSIYAGFVQSAVAKSGLPYDLFHVSTVDSALAYVRGEPPYNDRNAHPICHHQAANGTEFAVIERFPSGSNEIWTKGRNAVDVLKAFIHDQRHALSIWVEDINAQIKKFLAEKYPGQNMDCVAEKFRQRFPRTQHLDSPHNSI